MLGGPGRILLVSRVKIRVVGLLFAFDFLQKMAAVCSVTCSDGGKAEVDVNSLSFFGNIGHAFSLSSAA